MDYSIASYSFHRILESGKQDMFQYIADCKELGCAQLDPWNGHLVPLVRESDAIKASADPLQPHFSDSALEYVRRVRAAADEAGLPFGCLAVDGAHIYEPTAEQRQINRAAAYRWLEVAVLLGAAQMRIDSGGTEDMPDAAFAVIVEGFHEVVKRAREVGVEIIMENHWGASRIADNVVRILDAVEGLGLLFDSHNFATGTRDHAWTLCAPYARAVHIKTFEFDAQGNDPAGDVPRVIRLLVDAGYGGCWGIESVPRDGDEYGAVKKTIALLRRSLEGVKS